MMIVCAFLLSFLGAVLVYLSHERQRLLRDSLPPFVRMAGTMAIFISLWVWSAASGAAAGLAGALTTLMLAWVVLPYAAWWRGKHAVVVRAEDR
jgi:hypothetical protein